jgi:hypothetical protein
MEDGEGVEVVVVAVAMLIGETVLVLKVAVALLIVEMLLTTAGGAAGSVHSENGGDVDSEGGVGIGNYGNVHSRGDIHSRGGGGVDGKVKKKVKLSPCLTN